jgi:hypothetical protein
MTTVPASSPITIVRKSRVGGFLSSVGRKSSLLGPMTACAAVLAAAGAFTMGASGASAEATVVTNCVASPSSCGYPDATNTGVPAGTTLQSVPGQVSSGPGWYYNAAGNDVIVNVAGTVLSGLSITCNLEIDASNVTVNDVQVAASGNFGISLRHTTGVTIKNSTISGQNSTTGRLNYAIDDVYGDSTGMVVQSNNISNFRTAVQISTGMASGNYIHDPGYVAGDHTNGFYAYGGTTQSLTIQGNTILNSLGQTDAINLDAATSGVPTNNMAIKGNLLAGGSYTVYGGAVLGNVTSNIVIQNNRFGQLYYTKSGQYGPVAYFDSTGTGNLWSGNMWDGTGQTVPAP